MASGMGWGGGCTERESPGGRSGGWKLGESLELCWEPLSQGPSCPQPTRTSSGCWYPGQPQVEAKEVRRGGKRWDRDVSCEGPSSRAQPLPTPEPQAWHHLPRGLASSGLHPWPGECHRW